MSDPDRGAYTPPHDDHLAFDARYAPARRPVPMTLIASGVILVVLIGAVFLFYRSGVRGANEPPRAVGEKIGHIKSSSVDDAKPVDDAALDVYVSDKAAGGGGQPTFTAGPEQPQPRTGPQIATQASNANVTVAQAGPVTGPATPPLGGPNTPARESAAHKAQVAAAAVAKTQAVTKVAAGDAGAVKTKTADARSAPTMKTAKADTAPPALDKSAKTAVAAAAGTATVQIGAFSTPVLAEQEVAKVRAAFAKFTTGKGRSVLPLQRDGSTLYRTAFTGYSKPDAQAFCAALKAAGRSCIVK